jgi:predicted TIM-barrel fold metal-dependent hydrolase
MPPLVIDVHTHVFNHAHIPVEGVFRAKLLGFGWRNWSASLGARNMRRFINTLAWLGDKASPVWDSAHSGADLQQVAAHAAQAMLINDITDSDKDRLLVELEVFNAQDPYADEPLSIEQGVLGAGSGGQPKAVVGAFLDKLAGADDSGTGGLAAYIRFVMALLAPVDHLRDRLKEDYGAKPVALFVHLMMDMGPGHEEGTDCGFDPPPTPVDPSALRYPGMIEQLAELCWHSEGKLAGFVAFDPRRKGALELVKYALELGFVGVKIYPSMGYRPYDTRPEIHEALDGLYAYCAVERVPILTHCGAGDFESWPGYATYSRPDGDDDEGWDKVLEAYPDLILCFGHSGEGHNHNVEAICTMRPGEESDYPGWYDPYAQWKHPEVKGALHPRCWPATVLDLMGRYEHCYGDLSFLPAVIEDQDTADQVRDHLVRIAGQHNADSLFARLMFGSDWHMPELLGNTAHYLEVFEAIFQAPELEKYAEGFFGHNALRFLDLGRTAARVRGLHDKLEPEMEATLTSWEELSDQQLPQPPA